MAQLIRCCSRGPRVQPSRRRNKARRELQRLEQLHRSIWLAPRPAYARG